MTKLHLLQQKQCAALATPNLPSNCKTSQSELLLQDELYSSEDSWLTQESSASTMNYEHSASISSSNCSTNGADIHNAMEKQQLLSAKSSAEVSCCTSDDDGSNGSATAGFKEGKQLKHAVKNMSAPKASPTIAIRKDTDHLLAPLNVEAEYCADADNSKDPRAKREALEKRVIAAKPGLLRMEVVNPMDKEAASLVFKRSSSSKGLHQAPITLIKSNSVAATKADLLKLDMTNPHNWSNSGHRLSTGDSPLNLKRCGSQGPVALRSFPSPGTPSRSSFSGVSNSMTNHKAYMVGRASVNEANGKMLPLYNLPANCDQDINPGRLSVGFRAPPSKWDDAEKWLVNASPSHPQCSSPAALPPNSSNLAGTNHTFLENKKAYPKRVIVAPLPPPPQLGAKSHANTDTNTNMHYQSRALVPLPSSSSDSHLQQDEAATVSDSEISNTQEDDCRIFLRSSSHKHKEGDAKHRNKNLARKMVNSKEKLLISSPATLQLQGLKASSNPHEQQLPKMHDVYADTVVKTLRDTGRCPSPGAAEGGDAGTRLVVSKWAGAAPMRDASTDVSPKAPLRRDMGTQITPIASSKTSRSTTPPKSSSPVRHNTPARKSASSNCNQTDANHASNLLELENFHLAKLEHRDLQPNCGQPAFSDHSSTSFSTSSVTSSSWKSLQGAASDHKPAISDINVVEMMMEPSATSAAAWELEAERSKHMTKCAREEARIDAWEKHQKAKAEAEMKKLEMKLERLRAQSTEKIMNKVAAAHLRAEEMRAAARAQQAEQLAKALERANSIRKGSYFPDSLGRVCFAILP